MSDTNIDFEARLYLNDKFGKSIGKNRTNTYIYNGTLDLKKDGANKRKYLLDLSQANEQSLSFLTGELADWFVDLYKSDKIFQVKRDDLLISRLRHYELGTKKKEFVKGFALQNQKTNKLLVALSDHDIFMEEEIQLSPSLCEKNGRKICDLFAANYDA